MVTGPTPDRARRSERGTLTMELIVAMAILVAVVIPLGFSFMQEQKLCRAYYFRAVAMEIIDGEMEILQAGEWRAFPQGTPAYPVRAASATNLPPGHFVLTFNPPTLRLEWTPEKKEKGGSVSREIKITDLRRENNDEAVKPFKIPSP